jgi:hypothetical protein
VQRPTLYVRVTTAKEGHSELYAVNVGVELQQEVTLVHNPSLRLSAPTWSTARLDHPHGPTNPRYPR